MLRRFIILASLLAGILSTVWAQDGKLSGKVLDKDGAPLGFTTVVVYQGDLVKHGTQTAEDGTFSIQPVLPGTYRVEARYLGTNKSVDGVTVLTNQTRQVTITFQTDVTTTLDEVVIYEDKPFEKTPIVGTTLTGTDVTNAATRNIQSLASLTPGVYQGDEGENISIRGSRSTATVYYIDGVKVRGQSALPQASIAQLQVITGGTPAEFGDFTGGVVNITTANPSPFFSGGIEAVTSEYLDNFGHNLGAFSLSGPIITKTRYLEDTQTEFKSSLLGFFVNGEVEYNRDQDPAALGIFQLRDGLLDDLQATPVQISEDGLSFRSRANFITKDDFENIPTKVNNESLRMRGLARLDFQPTDNILVKVGGNVEWIEQDNWGIGNMLFSPENYNVFQGAYYRGFARFQQSFQGGKNSAIRNLFYSIQADYSLYQRRFQHEIHQDNYFDYGYVGKFDFDIVPVYQFVRDPNSEVSSGDYWQTVGYAQDNLRFDPTDSRNPLLSNYNTAILDHVEQNGIANLGFGTSNDATVFNLANPLDLAFRQGIRNGSGPGSIYSIFSGLGARRGTYQKFDFEQFRLSGQATAEIKGHNIKAGFEFEQRIERSYFLNSSFLWTMMRRYANFHLANLDDDPDSWLYNSNVGGEWNDTISIPLKYVAADQKFFDQQLRSKLGLPIDGTDFVNIDALAPDFFSLDMFNADELLDNGLGAVSYYGYDFKGNRSDAVAPERFFSDKDNRPENPFSPTYISAFIQDKFELEDIIFNVGVRVDRFDANQQVLRDPYSLYPTFTAGELATGQAGIPSFDLPAGIGSDFVPYVDDPVSFTEILGYRNGEVWYDANGTPISSAELARRSGGRVLPAITQDSVSIASFEDYQPQTTVMPRVSFSFPISDVALFFAHYDVLAQRPGQLLSTQSSLLAGQISDYAFLENRPTATVVNPNLKPEITIDYEAGFKQRIGERVAMTMSAFYREQRNMIRFRRFANAYPFSYDTYDNLDFGTVKGFSFALDMRRTRNVQLRGSYTLQFADATGSDFNSARAVVNFLEGVGVLRTTLPINTDQRHRIAGTVDYRFSDRSPGPSLKMGDKTIFPLKNFGANATVYLGSGTPFTKNSVAIPSVASGVNLVNQIEGTPNGARLPWQYRIDVRLDKSFVFGGKVKADGSKSRIYDLVVYLQTLNVLNTLNIRSVYRFTGLPDDDGFLSSDSGNQVILSQIDPTAYVDQYSARVSNPNNFTIPRRIRLGLNFNF
ncbi:MAG: TonB-dependent receptor [Bacteroidota bacterium]